MANTRCHFSNEVTALDISNIDKITLLSTIGVTANACIAQSQLSEPPDYPNFTNVSQEVQIIEILLYIIPGFCPLVF